MPKPAFIWTKFASNDRRTFWPHAEQKKHLKIFRYIMINGLSNIFLFFKRRGSETVVTSRATWPRFSKPVCDRTYYFGTIYEDHILGPFLFLFWLFTASELFISRSHRVLQIDIFAQQLSRNFAVAKAWPIETFTEIRMTKQIRPKTTPLLIG